MSRFEKYRSDSDQPALVKLEPGQTGTFKVTGDHEYVAKDNEGNEKIIPVLDLEERDGTPRAWMTGSWHGLEELALADPRRRRDHDHATAEPRHELPVVGPCDPVGTEEAGAREAGARFAVRR